MKNFEVLREPISSEPGWEMENFYDLSGNNFPTRTSERATIIQILVACGILESEEGAEFITNYDLDRILIENNIAVTFIDSKGE